MAELPLATPDAHGVRSTKKRAVWSSFSLLLGAVYLVAFLCVSILAHTNHSIEGRRKLQRGRSEGAPRASSPPPPPPPPVTASAWTLTAESDAAPLFIRAATSGKYFAISSSGVIRPSALDAANALAIRPIAARHADGRSGWALSVDDGSHSQQQLIAVRTATKAKPGALELRPASEKRFTVWRLPPIVMALGRANATAAVVRAAVRIVGEAQPCTWCSIHNDGCLRFPSNQKEPALALTLDPLCEAESDELSFEFGTFDAVECGGAEGGADDRDEGEGDDASEDATAKGGGPVHIALGVAVRTHQPTAPAELPLLKVFVPSLVATIRDATLPRRSGRRCAARRVETFEYTLYLGFDANDPTYDDPVSMAGVAAALRIALRSTPVRVIAVRYSGADKGAPCWVWNKLFARACTDQPSGYFYQLNDDLRLITPRWAPRFVDALRSSTPPNFGIAGPLDLNNERLMTQSFAHCTHFRALGFYYPWRFKNWYSDDYAAQLYAERTHWLTDVEVDHSLTKGPRYLISYEHARVVRPLVASSRARLCAYLRKQLPGENASSLFSPCAGLDGDEGAAELASGDQASGGERVAMAAFARLARGGIEAAQKAAPSVDMEERQQRHARLLAAVEEWKASEKLKVKLKRRDPREEIE